VILLIYTILECVRVTIGVGGRVEGNRANYEGTWQSTLHPTFCEWKGFSRMARSFKAAHASLLRELTYPDRNNQGTGRKSRYVQNIGILGNWCLKPRAIGHSSLHIRKLEFQWNSNTVRWVFPFLATLWDDEDDIPVSCGSRCNGVAAEAERRRRMSCTVLPVTTGWACRLPLGSSFRTIFWLNQYGNDFWKPLDVTLTIPYQAQAYEKNTLLCRVHYFATQQVESQTDGNDANRAGRHWTSVADYECCQV
jgi:hypothetical protein